MDARFCTRCGAPLDQGARFCTSCGAAVDAAPEDFLDAVRTEKLDVAQTAALEHAASAPAAPAMPAFQKTERMEPSPFAGRSGVSAPVGAGHPADAADPASATAFAPAVTPIDPHAAHRPAKRRGLSPLALGGIAFAVAFAVVGGIAAAVVIPSLGGPQGGEAVTVVPGDGASSEEAEQEAARRAEEEAAAEAAAEEERERQLEEQRQATLRGYYDQLAGLDESIRTHATNFNNLFLSPSLADRNEQLRSCRELRASIQEGLEAVEALDVPAGSAHYGSYTDVRTLYDDLYHRIDVIVEAWEIDVRYEDPADHRDEITAPIQRDNIGTVNKYLIDYEERYPGARP